MPKVFVYGVDSLFSRSSYLVSEIVNYLVDLSILLFGPQFLILQDYLKAFDHLMSACCKSTHRFVLVDYSVQIVLGLLELLFFTQKLFVEGSLLFFHHLNVKLLAISGELGRLFVPGFFVKN